MVLEQALQEVPTAENQELPEVESLHRALYSGMEDWTFQADMRGESLGEDRDQSLHTSKAVQEAPGKHFWICLAVYKTNPESGLNQ